MKIVHVVESFGGGVYDFLFDLISGLPEYKHIVIHGIRGNTPRNFQNQFPSNTRFFLWRNASREINPGRDLLALMELIKLIRELSPLNVIHLHSSKAGFLGRVAARTLNLHKKAVYTSHGVSFLRKDVSKLKLKQFILFEKIASRLGGKIIACSKSEAEIFQEHGIDADYIYNGIKCKQSSMKKSSKEKNIITIGTIGRITYQKNPELFNKIAENFLQRRNIKFLWIGDGELSYKLKSPNIILTGWLPRKEVENKLQEIDIYLSTSLWEGLPLSVLQAMCAAKPLVLSDCVGNRDLVLDNGSIFRNVEGAVAAIFDLMKNPKKRKVWGFNSYKLVKEKFSIENMVREYKCVYKLLNK